MKDSKPREGIPMTPDELEDYNQVWIEMEESIKALYEEKSIGSRKIVSKRTEKMPLLW